MAEVVSLEVTIPAFFSIGNATRVLLPNAIELQDQAFYGCSQLTNVVAPKLRHVGSAAFMFCRSIDWSVLKVVLTLGPQACAHAGGGGDVWLPECVSIGDRAFAGARVGALHAPAAYVIGPGAFKGSSVVALHLGMASRIPVSCAAECGGLREVSCPKATSMCESAFADCIAVQHVECPPQRSIAPRAFYNCRRLCNFDLSVCSMIGFEAFAGSGIHAVHSVVVAIVGKQAFSKCTSLASVILPTCTEIMDRAFDRSGVELVQVKRLEKVGHGAFWNCSGLTVDFGIHPGNTLTIGPYAFANSNIECIVCGRPTTLGSAAFLQAHIKLLSLPNLTRIANASFYGATVVDPLVFPNLDVVEYGAFYSATLASGITLPGATAVGETAFAHTNTPNIHVGKCEYVGAQAFRHAAVDDLVLPACTRAGDGAFAGMSALRITAMIHTIAGTCPLFWLRSRGEVRAVKVPSIRVATNVAVCITLCLQAAGIPADIVAHTLFLTPSERFTACNTAAYI